MNSTGVGSDVAVRGRDDAGVATDGYVTLRVPAGEAAEFTAVELETGEPAADRTGPGTILGGALGDGKGKWQLSVEPGEQQIVVMSLLRSPTGHLTNLSTVPGRPSTAQ